MEIHTREMTKPIDANGFYEQAKHIVVEFVLDDLTILNLIESSADLLRPQSRRACRRTRRLNLTLILRTYSLPN